MGSLLFFFFFDGAGTVAPVCDVPRRRADEADTQRTRDETAASYPRRVEEARQ